MPDALRLTPTLAPEGNRHKRPWSDSARTPLVPLWTANAAGQWFEGRFRVPARLAATEEHTNERHEFDRLVRENVERWVEWRRQKGWLISSEVRKFGPFDPPEVDAAKTKKFFDRATRLFGKSAKAREIREFDSPEEFKVCVVWARFKRETPAYVKLEDALYMRELGQRYGIPEGEDILPFSRPAGGDSGWVDPMKYAAQRRKRLGINVKDYRFPAEPGG